MISQNILIAIGYFKTGSSWLDRHLFKNPSSGFIWWSDPSLRHQIVGPHPLAFDLAKCSEKIQSSIPSSLNDKIPVIALERLSGHPHSGGYDSKEIADRLIALFPKARILIVIREQKQMILSTYNQYVRASGPCSLRNYIGQPTFRGYKIPLFSLDHFAYNFLIDYYQKLFGRSNVLVLPYEQFKTDPKRFVAQILEFNGIKDCAALVETLPYHDRVNSSLSWMATLLMGTLNPLIMKPSQLNTSPLLPLNVCNRRFVGYLQELERKLPLAILKPCNSAIKDRLMATITEVVGDYYQESNAITSELIGIDLSQYNYDMPVDYSFFAGNGTESKGNLANNQVLSSASSSKLD
ncbi:sulfotransferase [Moorena producens JHB]|uniref:Sulfotransferase n=1 Tax=Moorena producens (strain JHB) TaxID=1454205 RepID=A0A1D9G1T6_MOOP1|nr:sulfotransferase [Moorena producens]AOY81586.1 sulfotransferase [Moorena producens JHB]